MSLILLVASHRDSEAKQRGRRRREKGRPSWTAF
jgi:hypothetical protein